MQSIVSAGLSVIATPKGVTQLTYIKMAHTRKRRPQYITENIYLNDNKIRWPRMVISRKYGVDITHKC